MRPDSVFLSKMGPHATLLASCCARSGFFLAGARPSSSPVLAASAWAAGLFSALPGLCPQVPEDSWSFGAMSQLQAHANSVRQSSSRGPQYSLLQRNLGLTHAPLGPSWGHSRVSLFPKLSCDPFRGQDVPRGAGGEGGALGKLPPWFGESPLGLWRVVIAPPASWPNPPHPQTCRCSPRGHRHLPARPHSPSSLSSSDVIGHLSQKVLFFLCKQAKRCSFLIFWNGSIFTELGPFREKGAMVPGSVYWLGFLLLPCENLHRNQVPPLRDQRLCTG